MQYDVRNRKLPSVGCEFKGNNEGSCSWSFALQDAA